RFRENADSAGRGRDRSDGGGSGGLSRKGRRGAADPGELLLSRALSAGAAHESLPCRRHDRDGGSAGSAAKDGGDARDQRRAAESDGEGGSSQYAERGDALFPDHDLADAVAMEAPF